jgi:hypothetical protein
MSTELFEIPESISPKLAFIRKHEIELLQPAAEWVGKVIAETGEIMPAWFCRGKGVTGGGDTGDDALIDWCNKTGTQHWTTP